MTYEFKKIVENAFQYFTENISCVLATVVDLDGSSYRKPGVRMLISETGEMTGAVSGGCVEKEVIHRAQSVFETGQAKIISYDGRYRLGCEGVLYILIEPFEVTPEFRSSFDEILQKRLSFQFSSYYQKQDELIGNFGSIVRTSNQTFSFSKNFRNENTSNCQIFSQEMRPCFKLLIIGAEHDSVQLCTMAAQLGFEVDVICSVRDPKQLSDFPGANSVTPSTPDSISLQHINEDTAVVLMTHNYALDLKYLIQLNTHSPNYIGILGSIKRSHKLQDEIFEYIPDISEEFLELIHSPAGLNIGAITPEEIALSILSEILAITRKKNPFSLREISGKIHS